MCMYSYVTACDECMQHCVYAICILCCGECCVIILSGIECGLDYIPKMCVYIRD